MVGRDDTLFASETGRMVITKRRYQDPQLKNKRTTQVIVSVEKAEDTKAN